MSRHWCTYCDVGLVCDEQAEAHEDSGHITHEIDYLSPADDHRFSPEGSGGD